MRYNRSYSLASMYPLISPRKPPIAPFKEFEPSRSEQAEDMWRKLCHGRPCDKELRNAQVHPRKRRRQITAKPVSLAVLAKLSWIGIFGNKPAPGTFSWNIALLHAGIETCTPRYMKCAKRDYFLFIPFYIILLHLGLPPSLLHPLALGLPPPLLCLPTLLGMVLEVLRCGHVFEVGAVLVCGSVVDGWAGQAPFARPGAAACGSTSGPSCPV